MFTKENTHFQLWRIFCILASLYSVAFYYFYQAPLFSVIFWVGQFLLIHFVHKSIQTGSRWTFLFYPVMMTLNFFVMKISFTPYISWRFDSYLNAIDSNIFGKNLSQILSTYAEPLYSDILSAIYICAFLILYFTCFLYLYGASIFQVRRFYNGLFSLISILFILNILLPTVGPYLYLKTPLMEGGEITALNNSLILQYSNYMDSFPAFPVAITFFLIFSFIRDFKIIGFILTPFLVLITLASLYLKFHYFSDVCLAIILALICFFYFSYGFKKNKIY